MNNWEDEVAETKDVLEAMHAVRETALRQCRLLIQTSAKCIRHVHRRQFDQARELLAEAKSISIQARESMKSHPELLYAGYLQDAEKELVEAAAILAWAQPGETSAPSRKELGVGVVSYLNGMGEAASECRRYVLDELRSGNLAGSEELLSRMETVYDDLITFDYPDALTGGLRRTCDALRAVIERTRADLTMTTVQYDLKLELQKTQEKLQSQVAQSS